MKEIAVADPRIKQFCDLITQGIHAWVEAGRVFCEILKDKPDAYEVILSDHQYLTRDILESFERIGRKEIYPYLLVDGSPGARALAALPYHSQVKLYQSKVPVVVRVKGKLEERRKRVSELTNSEASLVFEVNRVRTVQEQMKSLRERHCAVGKRIANTKTNGYNEASEPLGESSDSAALIRILTRAENLLLEARTTLGIIKLDSRRDELITVALRAVGDLRYFASHEEL